MKTLLVAAIAAVAFCGAPAVAADMPTKAPVYKAGPTPMFNWSGFYIGGTAGYGWGRSHIQQNAAATVDTTPEYKIDGFVGGGTAGFNWQSAQWVLGVETDISYANINGKSNLNDGLFFCGLGNCVTKVDWFGTARGRIGYAWDRFLPYVTGGIAYGEPHAGIQTAGPLITPGTIFSRSETKAGWTVGAGVEWAIASNWSTKLEYLHVDLGNVTIGTFVPQNAVVPVKFNVVRFGLNYKFWSGL